MRIRVILFILLLCIIAVAAAWNNSATMDEPYHILAGHVMVKEGVYDLNPEHPPLTKILSGLMTASSGLYLTSLPPVERLDHLNQLIHSFLYQNKFSALTILRLARFPMIFFFAALLALTYLWAKELYGTRGGWTALILLGTQPLLLGHAQIVHTDVASAFSWVFSFYSLHRMIKKPSAANGLMLGAALGLSWIIKFSTVYLVLFLTLSALSLVLKYKRHSILLPLSLALLVSGAVLVTTYTTVMRNQDKTMEHSLIEKYMLLFPDGGEARAELLNRVSSVSRAVAHYGLGLSYVEMTNRRGQGVNYLFGEKRVGGFSLYFLTCLLLKTTFPWVLLLLIAIPGKRPDSEEIGLLLLPAFLLLLVSSFTSYNIGARHILPALSLLTIFAARTAAVPSRKMLCSLLLCLQCLIPVTAFPHYIAHFNYLSGGRWMGERYLADSNLDWGQEWARMGMYIERTGIQGEEVTFLYIGTGDPSFHIPGSRNFFNDPEQLTRYVVLSRQVELVGEEQLLLQGFRNESLALHRVKERLKTDGSVVCRIGSALTLYSLTSTSHTQSIPTPAR